MTHNFEVITTTDKVQRDAMFRDFRENGDKFEKQAVKFSSVEPVLREGGGEQQFDTEQYYPTTGKDRFLKFNPKMQIRPLFRSTWSVAYPRS